MEFSSESAGWQPPFPPLPPPPPPRTPLSRDPPDPPPENQALAVAAASSGTAVTQLGGALGKLVIAEEPVARVKVAGVKVDTNN